MTGVDRVVPIAIFRPEYRAGTARSTFPIVQTFSAIGVSQEINHNQRISPTGPLFPDPIREIRAVRG
jgi:hypothetical protein